MESCWLCEFHNCMKNSDICAGCKELTHFQQQLLIAIKNLTKAIRGE
jgi:hypothetical protein